jgi:hypothetical protein
MSLNKATRRIIREEQPPRSIYRKIQGECGQPQQNARKRRRQAKGSQKHGFPRTPEDGNPFFGNFFIGQTIGDSGQDNGCKRGQKQGDTQKPGQRVGPGTALKDVPAQNHVGAVGESDRDLAQSPITEFERRDRISQPQEKPYENQKENRRRTNLLIDPGQEISKDHRETERYPDPRPYLGKSEFSLD